LILISHVTVQHSYRSEPYMPLPYQTYWPQGMEGWADLNTTVVSKQSAQDHYVIYIAVISCSNLHASLGKYRCTQHAHSCCPECGNQASNSWPIGSQATRLTAEPLLLLACAWRAIADQPSNSFIVSWDKPPFNFVRGQELTMGDIVCFSPQGRNQWLPEPISHPNTASILLLLTLGTEIMASQGHSET